MPAAVSVVGAGLAGSEAAWRLAQSGVGVRLFEMKPREMSPAHSSPDFCELVCSNSLRSGSLSNAAGLLKAELSLMGSLVMEAADKTRVAAGGAHAVDRGAFSAYITEKLRTHPLISVVPGRVLALPPEGYCIIATGPLTDGELAMDIKAFFGEEYLNFYDAAAPLVDFSTIDLEKAFFASRYAGREDAGDGDYINCPLSRDEYLRFVRELAGAREAPVHGFEDKGVFEGCMPVEVMARRGEDTLRFGPMKPVGLTDPRTGKGAYAVVQLRRDNAAGSVFNMVGFQTHLAFPEQKRVFSMIPGLEKAEFLRYGVMHRNSFLNAPALLDRFYRAEKDRRLFFAGQLTGVEGYIESAASGLYAGAVLAHILNTGAEPAPLPVQTATGALAAYAGRAGSPLPPPENYQPMNINFGIIDASGTAPEKKGKAARNEAVSARALELVSASFAAVKN